MCTRTTCRTLCTTTLHIYCTLYTYNALCVLDKKYEGTSGSTVRVQCKAVHVRVRVRVQLLYNVVRAAIKKHHTVCYCTCTRSTKVLSKVVVLSYETNEDTVEYK